MTKTMNARTSASAKPGDTEVAGLHRSRRLRRPTRSLGSATPKILPSTLPPAAADRSGCRKMKEDSRPRPEAQCLAVFNPVAVLSTYRTRKSVRTTRATPNWRMTLRSFCLGKTILSAKRILWLTSASRRCSCDCNVGAACLCGETGSALTWNDMLKR